MARLPSPVGSRGLAARLSLECRVEDENGKMARILALEAC
jgi:hypothetical protein